MKPILEVAYLTSDHGSTLDKCPGCKICDRIAELRELVDPDPVIKYKHLLEKGRDLKPSEVKYLIRKEVDRKTIARAMGLGSSQFNKIMEDHGLFKVRKRRGVEEVGKFTMIFEQYKELKAQGKTNKEIAEIGGIKEANLNYHIKKWKTENEGDTKVTPLKSKEVAPVLKESTEYTKALTDLKFKLSYSAQVNEDLDKHNQDLTEQNKQLQARIEKLEQEKLDLHAAANDTEKEAAVAMEYLKREEKLLMDVEYWKLQAETYKSETKRLNDTLIDERQEKDKYREESTAAKAYIKAVI